MTTRIAVARGGVSIEVLSDGGAAGGAVTPADARCGGIRS
jgi:hypothetical protein